jgi:hypothetical protein
VTTTWARRWHALTAVVAIAALVLQLVLILQGGRVLDEQTQPDLPTRLGRLLSYFTIQSNLLVAIAATQLALDPARNGRGWRVLRVAGVAGIAITGIVHFVLLRPLLDLTGADYVADKLLHMAVPVLAVVGWALFGPRPRVSRRDLGLALLWPFAWLAWTLVVGALRDWYPYPFLDPDEDGTGAVVVVSIGITALFVAVLALVAWIDGRARPTPDPAWAHQQPGR